MIPQPLMTTLIELLQMLSPLRKKVFPSETQAVEVEGLNTKIQFYYLKGYDLEAMELETVLHTDWNGEPVIEITVKGVGTDEGGNDPDEDVGVSVL